MLARPILLFLLCICQPLLSCQIIYLNGTSSVGKTTVAKALQEKLNTPYLHIGIDQIIYMMPEKVNNWEGGYAELGFSWKKTVDDQGNPLQILQMGPFARRIPEAMKDVVVALAKGGFNIIVDDVAGGDGTFESWKSALQEYSVLWVGLTAPLSVVEQRERERGDRQIGQGRAAAGVVHKGFVYDLFIDTSASSTEKTVKKIAEACNSKTAVK